MYIDCSDIKTKFLSKSSLETVKIEASLSDAVMSNAKISAVEVTQQQFRQVVKEKSLSTCRFSKEEMIRLFSSNENVKSLKMKNLSRSLIKKRNKERRQRRKQRKYSQKTGKRLKRK